MEKTTARNDTSWTYVILLSYYIFLFLQFILSKPHLGYISYIDLNECEHMLDIKNCRSQKVSILTCLVTPKVYMSSS